jgi:alpha-tubulin suppressor-like RCC1 family protein
MQTITSAPTAAAPRRLALVTSITLIAALGCGEDTAPPTGPESTPRLAAAAGSPLAFSQVSSGGAHSCGVTSDGRAYCWGSNAFGRLGDGTTSDRLTPTRVAGTM